MSNARISESLIPQFARVWETVREQIRQCPEDHWKTGDMPVLVPARQVCHIIAGADMYTSERFGWSRRFGPPIGNFEEEIASDVIPGKEQVMSHFDEVQKQVKAWINEMSDAQFLSSQKSAIHTGDTFLERALYLLRHCQHHVGEIQAELRRRNLVVANWR